MKIHFPKRQNRVKLSTITPGQCFTISGKDCYLRLAPSGEYLPLDEPHCWAVNLADGITLRAEPNLLVRPYECELLLKTSSED